MASLSRSDTTNSTSSRTESKNVSSHIETVFLYNEESKIANPTFQGLTKLGHLSTSSILGTQLGLDWALIELSEISSLNARNTIAKNELLKNVVVPRRIVSRLERDAAIVAIKGYSGISRGSISSSTTMMRLSHRSTFQEVWTVRLDSPLGKS